MGARNGTGVLSKSSAHSTSELSPQPQERSLGSRTSEDLVSIHKNKTAVPPSLWYLELEAEHVYMLAHSLSPFSPVKDYQKS